GAAGVRGVVDVPVRVVIHPVRALGHRRRIGLVVVLRTGAARLLGVVDVPVAVVVDPVRALEVGLVVVGRAAAAGVGGEVDLPVAVVVEPVRARRRGGAGSGVADQALGAVLVRGAARPNGAVQAAAAAHP